MPAGNPDRRPAGIPAPERPAEEPEEGRSWLPTGLSAADLAPIPGIAYKEVPVQLEGVWYVYPWEGESGGAAFYDNEIDALRDAVSRKFQVVFLKWGESLP